MAWARIIDRYSLRSAPSDPRDRSDVLETVANALLQEINRQRSSLNFEINGLCPIHQLPPELSSDILLRAVPDDSTIFSRIHTLAQVSKRWLQLIKATPAFWTQIRFGKGKASTWVRLSGELPLHIRCYRGLDVEEERQAFNTGGDSHEDFVDAVLPQRHRWQSLVIQGKCTIGLQLGQLILPSSSHVIERGSAFAGLKHIQFHDMLNTGPSFRELRKLLFMHSGLETLILRCWFPQSEPVSESESAEGEELIHLPHLENILIDLVPPDYLRNLVETIRAPNCSSIFIDGQTKETLGTSDTETDDEEDGEDEGGSGDEDDNDDDEDSQGEEEADEEDDVEDEVMESEAEETDTSEAFDSDDEVE